MEYLSLSEVRLLVEEANVPRWRGDPSNGDDLSDARSAERRLDDLFRTGHALATYGTLAPGRPNHQVVAPLGGEWAEGVLEGDLIPLRWGAELWGTLGSGLGPGERPWRCGC